MLVGLLLAFGVSLGVFTATYDQQASVDAQLTLGADVDGDGPARRGREQEAGEQRSPNVSGVAGDHVGRSLLRLRRP